MSQSEAGRIRVTGWYGPDVKPVRNGWYECEYCKSGIKHFWNGKQWTWGKVSMELFTPFKWRGLSKGSAARGKK